MDDDYDPNILAEAAAERDGASRLARERERLNPFGSEPLTDGQSASDEEVKVLLPEWDTQMTALTQALDSLEAGVQRIKRFLGVES